MYLGSYRAKIDSPPQLVWRFIEEIDLLNPWWNCHIEGTGTLYANNWYDAIETGEHTLHHRVFIEALAPPTRAVIEMTQEGLRKTTRHVLVLEAMSTECWIRMTSSMSYHSPIFNLFLLPWALISFHLQRVWPFSYELPLNRLKSQVGRDTSQLT